MTDTWTAEQFWRYAEGLIGAHECGQMREEMALRGLCVMPMEEIERLRDLVAKREDALGVAVRQVERMKDALCMIVGLGGRHDLIDAQKFASSALSSTERGGGK